MTQRLRDPETGRFVSSESSNGGSGAGERQFVVMSEADFRERFGGALGLTYEGKRDIYKIAGWPKSPKFPDYWIRYLRQPAARRVVDMPVQTTWRNPPYLVETDKEEEETEFTRAFESMRKRLRLWHHFERVDKLARVGRYGVLMIGVRGSTDQTLHRPMTRLSGPDDVLYLRPFHEGHAEVERLVSDGSERHGLPEFYKVQLTSDVANFQSRTVRVHHSRTLHILEDALEDDVYGRPAMEPVLNPLVSLETVEAATQTSFWHLADKVLVATIDPKTKVDDTAKKALTEALGEMMHDTRRTVSAQGLTLSWLGSEIPDPSAASKLFMMEIAGTKGIPFRTMFGNETGERSSTEDQKQYLGSISERHERFAEPVLVRAFVDRMIDMGALTRPSTGYEVVWPTLWETPEKDVAETDALVAKAAKDLTPMGGDPLKLVDIDKDGRPMLAPRKVDDPSPFDIVEPEPVDILPDGTEAPGGMKPEGDSEEEVEEAA